MKLRADIRPQPVTAALAAFAEQTGLNVGYASEIIKVPQSKGARAGLTLTDALTQLLDGTGLRFEFTNPRTVIISRAPTPAPEAPSGERTPRATPALPIEQVVITASRREERVDRVPGDVVVWTQETLEASGAKGLADIGALTPGVEFDFFSTVGSGAYTNLAIRGVTDRHGTATGLFLDDTPFPPARSNTFGRVLPVYFDLDRIEVIRGPQGTLLGGNTQGGAVGFIPTQPSLTTFTGLAHAEWATTARGDPSYEAGAAVGGPLVPDVLGFRVSGWHRLDGGYIDRIDPFTGAVVDRDSNRATSKSLRGALTYAPTASLSITPSLSYVSAIARDSPSFFTYLSNPSAGQLHNGSLLAQPFEDTFYLASLRLAANLRAAKLDTVTAYFHRAGNLAIDDTESVKWGGWGNPLGPEYPASYSDAVTTYTGLKQRVISQEVRLASKESDSSVTWVAGGFFSSARSREADHVVARFIPVLGGPLDASNATSTTQRQWAGFAQLASKIARRFTVSAGVRVEREQYDSVSEAPPVFHARAAETLVVPKFALSYAPGARDLFYFSAAKGYAPAGVDAALPTCFLNPTVYPTDTVWSYELGAKDLLLRERAHLDVAAFHIRWNNGPVSTGNCIFTHLPGTAVSNGFDLTAEALLYERTKARLAISYTDAHYTQTVQAGGHVIVHNGDALGTPPLVTSPWNVTASIERHVSFRDGAVVRLRAEDVFHSRNPGPFYTGDPASPYYAPGLLPDPATNVLNLRADLMRASFDIGIFVNNALDSQPTLLKRNKGFDVNTLFYATTFRPRTVGLSGTWHFRYIQPGPALALPGPTIEVPEPAPDHS